MTSYAQLQLSCYEGYQTPTNICTSSWTRWAEKRTWSSAVVGFYECQMVTLTQKSHTGYKWGLCALRHGIQNSMEAILACHPAGSTEWLDCGAKWCERWRMHTSPIGFISLNMTHLDRNKFCDRLDHIVNSFSGLFHVLYFLRDDAAPYTSVLFFKYQTCTSDNTITLKLGIVTFSIGSAPFVPSLFPFPMPLKPLALCFSFPTQAEDQRVCNGIVNEFQHEIITVIAQAFISPDVICGYLLGNTCAHAHNPFTANWTVPLINSSYPPYVPPDPQPGAPTTKFLFLSDIHYDVQYSPGSLAKCDEPLCCRSYLGNGTAGTYGSFHCDSPMPLLENLFEHLAKQWADVIDYVIFTGDIPPHNVWNQTREDQLKALSVVCGLFKRYLPNVTIYPAVGNHESAPINSFPPPYVTGPDSNSWLLDALAEQWKEWLPDSSLETVRKGKHPKKFESFWCTTM